MRGRFAHGASRCPFEGAATPFDLRRGAVVGRGGGSYSVEVLGEGAAKLVAASAHQVDARLGVVAVGVEHLRDGRRGHDHQRGGGSGGGNFPDCIEEDKDMKWRNAGPCLCHVVHEDCLGDSPREHLLKELCKPGREQHVSGWASGL